MFVNYLNENFSRNCKIFFIRRQNEQMHGDALKSFLRAGEHKIEQVIGYEVNCALEPPTVLVVGKRKSGISPTRLLVQLKFGLVVNKEFHYVLFGLNPKSVLFQKLFDVSCGGC